jgi:uncharacterized protein YegP (UPF0339 family)
MNGKYTVNAVGKTEYHWNLMARNAQTMLSSAMCADKAGAETGIEACRLNSPDEARYERLVANDTRYFFVLRTAEGDVIGTSETYYSLVAREKAIVLCKESGPIAKTTYAIAR